MQEWCSESRVCNYLRHHRRPLDSCAPLFSSLSPLLSSPPPAINTSRAKTQMLKSCDFTGRSCYVNRLCGRLDNSESFSSASQSCITRTPTAAPRLQGLRREGQPQSPSVFAWTRRAFSKSTKARSEMCHDARCFLKFNLPSLTRWTCVLWKPGVGRSGGFADIGIFEFMSGCSHWETVGFSKKCLLIIFEQKASIRANLLREMV